jgi:hypothetical protein
MAIDREVLNAADLRTVPAVDDGITRLESDILGRAKVFCVCATARDYHVGVADSRELLRRNEQLFAREENPENANQVVFVPKSPLADAADLQRAKERAKEDLGRVFDLLQRAYPSYERGVSLHKQPTVLATFTDAFRRLRRLGILPATTQNALFNHQGMTLLMEACFAMEGDFVRYLRDPACLAE